MTLPTRRLGTTDMHITTLGFGAWAIGGGDWSFGWGAQDDADSVAAIRHAVEVGINWIDTAAVYGLGHSEEVVAKALKDIPDAERPLVFTKCGLVWDAAQPFVPAKRIGRADSIRADVDASLRRLGVERIDLMQVHWPAEDGAEIEEYWGELAAAQQALAEKLVAGRARQQGHVVGRGLAEAETEVDQQVLLRDAGHFCSEQALHQETVHLGDHVIVVWVSLHVARLALHVHQDHGGAALREQRQSLGSSYQAPQQTSRGPHASCLRVQHQVPLRASCG